MCLPELTRLGDAQVAGTLCLWTCLWEYFRKTLAFALVGWVKTDALPTVVASSNPLRVQIEQKGRGREKSLFQLEVGHPASLPLESTCPGLDRSSSPAPLVPQIANLRLLDFLAWTITYNKWANSYDKYPPIYTYIWVSLSIYRYTHICNCLLTLLFWRILSNKIITWN